VHKKEKYVFEKDTEEELSFHADLKVTTVQTYSSFLEFYHVPWLVYADDENWVPPLLNEIRNFFRLDSCFWTHAESRLFLASKEERTVGRVAAIIDRNFSDFSGKRVGYFGYFECIRDTEVALVIFDAAKNWLASRGIQLMRGPINGRVENGCGFLSRGFGSLPYITATYSPDYYLSMADEFGFQKAKDLFAYYIDLKKPIPPSVKEAAERCTAEGVKIRNFQKVKFGRDIKIWLEILSSAFSDHWGFSPLVPEKEDNQHWVKRLRWIIDPKLFFFAEVKGTPVGFRWSLPDFNQLIKNLDGRLSFIEALKFPILKKRINRGKFIIMGIRKEARGRGIGTCMNYHTLLEMKKRGYFSADYGWIDENNIASRKAGEKIRGKLYKIYQVFEKTI
jgi:hypothetical protein